MNKIALFLPNWIGDVVMATPAIRAVREHFPQAVLLAVCKPYVAALLDGSPWFDEVILHDAKGPWKNRGFATVRKLRNHASDAAVLFPNSFRSALIACLAGCKRRIGFVRYRRAALLTDRLKPVMDDKGRLKPSPIIDEYNRLVEPLGIETPGHRLQLHTRAEDDAAAGRVWMEEEFDKAPEVIGLNSGGAFGAAKHWPIEHFAKLAQDLVDRRGSAVLILCGPNERELAEQIVVKANRRGVASLARRDVSLGLTKACVRRLNLLVTTDSGPRHFAAAFDRPVLTLFGPTFIQWTETFFRKAIHMQKKVPCGPCQLRVCPLDHRCMRDLSVEDVYRAACELLRQFPAESEGLRDAS